MEDIAETISWSLSEWVCSRTEFPRAALEDLNRSWAAHFQRRWVSKPLISALWECPPMGTLKLKFDVS